MRIASTRWTSGCMVIIFQSDERTQDKAGHSRPRSSSTQTSRPAAFEVRTFPAVSTRERIIPLLGVQVL